MTSNRKAKKMSAMEAHRVVNRQFYRRQEVLDYPDIIHVKNDDPHRSDVVEEIVRRYKEYQEQSENV